MVAEDLVETLQTLVVPTVEPVSVKVDTSYRRSLKPHAGLADLSAYDAEFWDDASGGEATILTTWTCVGPHGIVVESAKLVREVRILSSVGAGSCLILYRTAGTPVLWIVRSRMTQMICCQVHIIHLTSLPRAHRPHRMATR